MGSKSDPVGHSRKEKKERKKRREREQVAAAVAQAQAAELEKRQAAYARSIYRFEEEEVSDDEPRLKRKKLLGSV